MMRTGKQTEERQLVALRDLEGLSVDESCTILEVSEAKLLHSAAP
jgi:DNA-directed RNA polymerase specialized sigma24 family protein